MGQRPSATIVYGFEIDDISDIQIPGCEDYHDINAAYDAFVCEGAGLSKDDPDYYAKRAPIHDACAFIVDWGGGEDTRYVIGVTLVRADWDGVEPISPRWLEDTDGDQQTSVLAFCEFAGIAMGPSGHLLLVELS